MNDENLQAFDITDSNGTRRILSGYIDPNATNPHDRYRNLEYTQKRLGAPKQVTKGLAALYTARDANGEYVYKGPDTVHARSLARGNGDIRDTDGYAIGRAIRNSILEPNTDGPVSSFLSGIPRPVKGAVLLGGGAALASWLANKLDMDVMDPGPAALIGAGLGAGGILAVDRFKNRMRLEEKLRGAADTVLETFNKESAALEKKASLYHDPRNFILEKLQRDTQLSMSDKAMLAGKIRSMSMPAASELEKTVRSALGVGVGAMLANYFGLGPLGGLMGGVLGGLAFNQMGFGGNLLASTRTPSMYNAFHLGGKGFSTYNEFFRSVNSGA